MIVAFTGHRPNKLGGYKMPNPVYLKVCQQIDKALKELNPEKIISGMALGVDQWAASIAIKLNIPFVAAIPFLNQDKVWTEQSKRIYQILLKKSAEQVIVSEGGYSGHKLQIRNEWMVDHCDQLIAIYNGDLSGGTYNCIQYAKSRNKNILYIGVNP